MRNRIEFYTMIFSENQIKYDEKDNYFIVESNYIDLSIEDIKTILEEVTITGTKGITNVTVNIDKDEYTVVVTGINIVLCSRINI